MSFLHERCVIPLAVWLRGEAELYPELEQLKRLEYAPPSSLEAFQAERLHQTLSFASANVSWYRHHLAPILDTGRVHDLTQWPVLTKVDIQRAPEAFHPEAQPRRVTRKTTGGSTGQPVTLMKDRHAIGRELAASAMGYSWFGVRMGQRSARFWGSPQTRKRALRSTLADAVMNRKRFSAFAFDQSDLSQYWRALLKLNPRFIYGYVSMIEALAHFVRSEGLRSSHLKALQAVITTAEALSPRQREVISRTFGVPIQNEYGCGEVGPIAYECPQGSLHVMAANLKVEILDQGGAPVSPGSAGRIVLTDLNNRAMPLIRYDVGDRAAWGTPCSCGRSFPVLQEVFGRAYDFVTSEDGRRYHGEFFMYIFEDLRDQGLHVDQFKVIQRSTNSLEVQLRGDPEAFSYQRDRVQAEISRRLPGFQVAVLRKDTLERAPSGKIRVIEVDLPS